MTDTKKGYSTIRQCADGGIIVVSVSPEETVTGRTAVVLEGKPVILYERCADAFKTLEERIDHVALSLNEANLMQLASDREIEGCEGDWLRFQRTLYRALDKQIQEADFFEESC